MTRIRKFAWITILSIVGIALPLAAFVEYSVIYGRPVAPARPGTIKVACVGDSITFGDFFFASKRYPQQLEELLGSAYSVRNFGAVGYTAQKTADHPYWGHRYFAVSSDFAPDIVLIMLGTNDSKTQNWTDPERFFSDYRALIQHYQSLPGKPRVILMTPPNAFLLSGRSALPSGMDAAVITRIADGIKQLGATMGLTVIDIHAVTAPHPEFFTFDGIHPNREGAGLIAKAVYEVLSAGHATAPASVTQ